MVRLFAGLGFDKFRLTGGEPTVRTHIVDLVREIAQPPGVRSLSMTTNGVLLAQLAQPLAEAGLQRVNVSIDTLDPAKFQRLTRWGTLDEVLARHLCRRGSRADCRQAQRGGGARLQRARCGRPGPPDPGAPWQVRFIEMMPFAGATELQLNQVVTAGGYQAAHRGRSWVRWRSPTAASWMARPACTSCLALREPWVSYRL